MLTAEALRHVANSFLKVGVWGVGVGDGGVGDGGRGRLTRSFTNAKSAATQKTSKLLIREGLEIGVCFEKKLPAPPLPPKNAMCLVLQKFWQDFICDLLVCIFSKHQY